MATVISRAELLLQGRIYSGSGDWLDQSGNGHDATPVGSPIWNGSYFTLDGSQYFDVADHANLDFGAADDFSVMVVGRAPTIQGAALQSIIAKKTSSGAPTVGYLMYLRSNSAAASFQISDGVDAATGTSPTTLVDNQRFVVAGVRNTTDDNIEVFADGTGAASITDPSTLTLANAEVLRIGAEAGTADKFLTGDIFDVVVWSEALPPADIVTADLELKARPAVISGRRLAGVNTRLRAA